MEPRRKIATFASNKPSNVLPDSVLWSVVGTAFKTMGSVVLLDKEEEEMIHAEIITVIIRMKPLFPVTQHQNSL